MNYWFVFSDGSKVAWPEAAIEELNKCNNLTELYKIKNKWMKVIKQIEKALYENI